MRKTVSYMSKNTTIITSSDFNDVNKVLNNPNYVYAMCRTNKGDIESHPFTNESVCWIDLIYIMEGMTNKYELFNNIDMEINMERLIQQKEREEAKKKK